MERRARKYRFSSAARHQGSRFRFEEQERAFKTSGPNDIFIQPRIARKPPVDKIEQVNGHLVTFMDGCG